MYEYTSICVHGYTSFKSLSFRLFSTVQLHNAHMLGIIEQVQDCEVWRWYVGQCGRVIARFSFKQHLYRAVYYILHASESQVNSAHTHLRDTYILFMNYSWYVDQPTWRFSTAPHQCAKEGNIIKWLLCNRDLYELLVEIHSARLQSTKALPFLHARTSRCTISLVVSPVCMSHSPERTDHIRACAVMIPIAFPEPCAM